MNYSVDWDGPGERDHAWDRDFCPECGEEAEQYRKARHCGACVLTWDGTYIGYDPEDDYQRITSRGEGTDAPEDPVLWKLRTSMRDGGR